MDENYDHELCVYASKCTLEGFQHEGCEDPNPCRTHPQLCLTICDIDGNKTKKRCIVEKCNLFPDLAECEEFKHCKINPECLGDDKLTDNQCCPEDICNPQCHEDDTTCNPVDPVDECTWGYTLGEAVVDLLIEPLQKQEIDETGINKFVDCYNEYVVKKNSISLECFSDSIGEGYTVLSKSLEESMKTINELTGEYDTVNLVTDEENKKEFTLESSEVPKDGESLSTSQ